MKWMIFDYEMFQFKLFSIIKYPAETVTITLLLKASNSFPFDQFVNSLIETILGLRSFDTACSPLVLAWV